MEIDHEIFSAAILATPYKRKHVHVLLVYRLVKLTREIFGRPDMTLVVDWEVKHHLYHCKCKDLSILLQLLNVLRIENGADHDDTA